MQTQINTAKTIELLMNADWSWVTSGGRVRESDMNEFCDEIKETISAGAVESVLADYKDSIIEEYEQQLYYNEAAELGSIEEFAARSIADSVAQSLVSGVDDSVSFIAYI